MSSVAIQNALMLSVLILTIIVLNFFVERRYSSCQAVTMQNVLKLSVLILTVIVLSFVLLNVVILAIMSSVAIQNALMLGVLILTLIVQSFSVVCRYSGCQAVTMQNVLLLDVVMQNVVILIALAPVVDRNCIRCIRSPLLFLHWSLQ
jgi:hypothetical protein